MVYLTTILAVSSLLALSSADRKEKQQPGGMARVPIPVSPAVKPRSLAERQTCSGSCSTCFGSGYILCPSSSLYCYLPGDATYGLDSCPGSSSGSTAAAAPTTTGSAGNSDFCSGSGATCISCFGPGYLECSDGINCYNPADPNYDTCPTGTSSSSGSSSSSSSGADCAEQFGAGNINCGADACYNPDDGESCCASGYYCKEGYTCGEEVGKCEKSGSLGSGLTSLLNDDKTSTSTGSSTFSTSNLSGGGSGSSSSSSSSNDDSASGAAGLGSGVSGFLGTALVAVGAFGGLVVAL